MDNAKKKNALTCFALICILLYILIWNASVPGVIAFLICSAAMIIFTVPSKKEKLIDEAYILSKLDFYVLFILLALSGIRLHTVFSFRNAENWLPAISAFQTLPFWLWFAAFVLSLVLSYNIKPGAVVWKYIRIYMICGFIMQFFRDTPVSYYFVLALLAVFFFSLFMARKFYRSQNSYACFLITALLLTVFYIFSGRYLNTIFTDTRYLGYLLTLKFFPWYNVLPLVLIFAGLSLFSHLHRGESSALLDEDARLFIGIAAFICVLKSLLFFFYQYDWLMLFLFALLWGYCRSIARKGIEQKNVALKALGRMHGLNPVIALFAMGTFFIFLVSVMMHQGAFLWAVAILFAIVVFLIFYFIANLDKNKKRRWLVWEGALFSISGVYFCITLYRYYEPAILALLVFAFLMASIVMWIMNNESYVRSRSTLPAKILICLTLIVIGWISAGKATANITAWLPKDAAGHVQGSVYSSGSSISIHATAGNSRQVLRGVTYAWNGGIPVELDPKAANLVPIKNGLLTITVTDTHGIRTIKNLWFILFGQYQASQNKSTFESAAQKLSSHHFL